MGKLKTLINLMKQKDTHGLKISLMSNFSHLKISHLVPDKKYLNMWYKVIFGKKINFKKPKTFNEKLQCLKIYDRNPKYIKLVDKYEVKKYIADKIGEEYIIPTLGIWDSIEDVDFASLPEQFVIKCTHDSGSTILCDDKKTFDVESAKNKLSKKLKENLFWWGREWPYKDVKPRIIAEKFMSDGSIDDIRDYKFMCFDGVVHNCFVCSDRKKNLKVTFYDLDWNVLPFERHYPKSSVPIDKPLNFNKMIELAKILSKGIPFVRVDFYEVNGKIYFGELTFFPGCGFEEFTPEEWDYKLGDLIKIPEK